MDNQPTEEPDNFAAAIEAELASAKAEVMQLEAQQLQIKADQAVAEAEAKGVDAVAAAVHSGRAGSEEEQERVIAVSKKVPGCGDYLSAHLYCVMMRVLGQQIESDELAVMGGTGKKEGWDAARREVNELTEILVV